MCQKEGERYIYEKALLTEGCLTAFSHCMHGQIFYLWLNKLRWKIRHMENSLYMMKYSVS